MASKIDVPMGGWTKQVEAVTHDDATPCQRCGVLPEFAQVYDDQLWRSVHFCAKIGTGIFMEGHGGKLLRSAVVSWNSRDGRDGGYVQE